MQSSTEIRQRAIDSTLGLFDFSKVEAATLALSLTWEAGDPDSKEPLSVEQIKDIARELLERAWDDEEAQNCEFCYGGLRASRTDGVLILQFVLEEAFFVAAIDAPGSKELNQ